MGLIYFLISSNDEICWYTSLKVQGDQREHQCFKVLDEIIEDSESFWILRFVDIDQRPYLSRLCLVSPSFRALAVQLWLTSKRMCSFPSRISSSCLPSRFFSGHLESSSLQMSVFPENTASPARTYFITSDSLTIFLISSTSKELTHP